MPDAVLPIFSGAHRDDASQRSIEKVYLYPKQIDFRKSIDGLAALVELDIKVAVFDPVLVVFLSRHGNRVKSAVLGAQRLLSLAQAPRFRAFPNLARRHGRGHRADGAGVELVIGRI